VYRRTHTPTSKQLESMNLKEGVNDVRFQVTSTIQGTATIEGKIYLYDYTAKIVISDVDGTITKSDVLGHVLPGFGYDWSHPGICDLFTKIKANGYVILYLTARAIGQAEYTRSYITGLR
jgi:phosphatidate phosphatase LPIN